ncbi:MAG: asparagine synthase (glutamine-hydrolyzing) [Synechococcaceae cyanobacterium]|nr:asparagine synthase (glutamine-hydrolyzing) [Synechococcaceae cyanobacterium]
MCGLAGLLAPPGVLTAAAAERFRLALDPALAHRGPDGAGCWQSEQAVLVHRRLAILDLSEAGQQPMRSRCGRWLLVFNGEIYNHRELRADLEARGERFRGSGDSEVLLAWLVRHGSAGLSRLRGMFAFCLYDSQGRSALLARDPHGIKPLYFWQGPHGELAFASELRALLAWGAIPRRLDTASLAAFLATGSVPEPTTLVQQVSRLRAGHLLEWQQGELQERPWGPLPESQPLEPDPGLDAGASARLARQALEESLQAHLVSDVPVGLFLSGGLDSGALLALAPPGLRTFTIGFRGDVGDHDESAAAAAIAAHHGAEHTPLPLDVEQARAWLPDFLDSLDQPSNDGFNTWCVSRLVTAHGLKVALSGLGGDELFGGYPSFATVPRLLRWRRRCGPLGPWLGRRLVALPRGQRARSQRLAAWLQHQPSLNAAYRCFRGHFAPAEIAALLQRWGLADGQALAAAQADGLEPPAGLEPREAVAWLEGRHYLRQQLLPDSDVLAMAAGLELRLPLVDAHLQRRLAVIPARWRLAGGKALLRQAVPELPEWYLRRPKQGFRFPFQQWLDDPDQPLELRLPPTPAGLDLGPWYRRWSLMVLQHWLRRQIGIDLGG